MRTRQDIVRVRKIRQKRLQKWLFDYKSTLKCETCGMNHPATLQFHHKNPKLKDINVGRAIKDLQWGKKRILEEISKCQVLCANCHFIHHWNEKL